MSHPSDELQGKAKLVYNSLHEHGVTTINKGGWKVFWSSVVAGCGFFFVYFFLPAAAVLFVASAYLQFKGLLTIWRGMQYLGAATNVIVQNGIQQFSSSHASERSPAEQQHDGYDYSSYVEVICGVDMQHASTTPLPNYNYPCDIETSDRWVITSPIGRVHVTDGSQLDFDAIRSGKARIETFNKLDLDSHGRLKATLSMPRRKLTSNANAA